MPSVGIELHATTVTREPLRISDHALALRARYVLGRPLAQGGMAALYLGQRIVSASSGGKESEGGFSKQVVLKRLRPELSQNRDALALFSREAELAASLDHPAIVRAFDLTELDGVPYLVMEYVRGGDLRLVLRRARRRNQRFSAAAGLYIGRELCAALEYTHTRHATAKAGGRPLGLIHRDISPTNILLSADGEIKLTDFGIAQAEAEDDKASEPRARGHVGYMSPEQARGEALDVRSDLFSLAAVLYEVFTDRRLFVGLVGQPAAEVYGQGAPSPPSQLCAELPPALDAVLLRALALPAAERPKSAAVLYQQLVDIAKGSGLFMDRAEFAAHLQKLCGPDPSDWASLEERTATALIAPFSAEHDEIAEHDEPLPGLVVQASAMNQARPPLVGATLVSGDASEPSEPAITVPWPTVAVERAGFLDGDGVPIVESDDTQPFPSGPVSIAEALAADSLAAARARIAPAAADDDDAVTGPAPRTMPPEKILPQVEQITPQLLNATTAPHLALPVSILETRPFSRIFSGDRLVGFAYGLTAGIVAGIIVALLAWALSQVER